MEEEQQIGSPDILEDDYDNSGETVCAIPTVRLQYAKFDEDKVLELTRAYSQILGVSMGRALKLQRKFKFKTPKQNSNGINCSTLIAQQSL